MSEQSNPSERFGRRRKIVFSMVFSCVCVLSLLAVLDFDDISSVEVDYWSAIASFFMLTLGYCTRSLFYKITLNDERISTREMYSVVSVHAFMLTLLPSGTGYLSYPYLLKKYFNIPVSRSVSSVSAFVVCRSAGLFLLAVWSWPATGLSFPAVQWAGFGSPVLMVILAMASTVLLYRWSLQYRDKIKLFGWITRYVQDTRQLFIDLCDIRMLSQLFILVVFNILMGVAFYYFAYRSFGASVPYISVCFLVSAGTFFSILPIHGLGKLGSYELFNAGLLALIGFNKNQAIQLSFEIHFLLLLQQALLWAISYIMLRQKKIPDTFYCRRKMTSEERSN